MRGGYQLINLRKTNIGTSKKFVPKAYRYLRDNHSKMSIVSGLMYGNKLYDDFTTLFQYDTTTKEYKGVFKIIKENNIHKLLFINIDKDDNVWITSEEIGGGSGGATIEDFINSNDIEFEVDEDSGKIKAVLSELIHTILTNSLTFDDFQSSDDIELEVDEDSGKIKAILSNTIKEILNNALSSSDFQSSDSIDIGVDTETGKLESTLKTALVNKITNSLQTPLETPTTKELVGIGTNKEQERITIGEGLELGADNILKAIGGGGGGVFEETTVKSEAIFALVTITTGFTIRQYYYNSSSVTVSINDADYELFPAPTRDSNTVAFQAGRKLVMFRNADDFSCLVKDDRSTYPWMCVLPSSNSGIDIQCVLHNRKHSTSDSHINLYMASEYSQLDESKYTIRYFKIKDTQ